MLTQTERTDLANDFVSALPGHRLAQLIDAVSGTLPFRTLDLPGTGPRNDQADALDEALLLCQTQQHILAKAQHIVDRMQAMAAASEKASATEKFLYRDEFQSLNRRLEEIAAVKLRGEPLFSKAHQIVNLEDGNRLVLAGIDLKAPSLTNLSAAEAGTGEIPPSQNVLRTRRFLTICQAIVVENLNRLLFHRSGLNSAMDSLRSTADAEGPTESRSLAVSETSDAQPAQQNPVAA